MNPRPETRNPVSHPLLLVLVSLTPLLPASEREFLIDNLLVRVHFMIVVIRWTGLAPWEFEFPFPGSLTSTFLVKKLQGYLAHKKTHRPRTL